jgi:hypothetical protein
MEVTDTELLATIRTTLEQIAAEQHLTLVRVEPTVETRYGRTVLKGNHARQVSWDDLANSIAAALASLCLPATGGEGALREKGLI